MTAVRNAVTGGCPSQRPPPEATIPAIIELFDLFVQHVLELPLPQRPIIVQILYGTLEINPNKEVLRHRHHDFHLLALIQHAFPIHTDFTLLLLHCLPFYAQMCREFPAVKWQQLRSVAFEGGNEVHFEVHPANALEPLTQLVRCYISTEQRNRAPSWDDRNPELGPQTLEAVLYAVDVLMDAAAPIRTQDMQLTESFLDLCIAPFLHLPNVVDLGNSMQFHRVLAELVRRTLIATSVHAARTLVGYIAALKGDRESLLAPIDSALIAAHIESIPHLHPRTTPLDANDASSAREDEPDWARSWGEDRALVVADIGILARVQAPLSLTHIARCSVWSTLIANAIPQDESPQSRSMADIIAQLELPALLAAFIRFE